MYIVSFNVYRSYYGCGNYLHNEFIGTRTLASNATTIEDAYQFACANGADPFGTINYRWVEPSNC